ARRVGDDAMASRLVGLLVHAEHDRGVRILRRRRDDHLLGAGLQVLRGGGGVAKDAGGLDDHVDAEVTPGQRRRILERTDPDLASVHEERLALGGHFRAERAVNGIVLQQVAKGLGVRQVVDADHLDILRLERGAEKDPPDPTESIDTDANGHGRAPMSGDLRRSTSPNYTAGGGTRARVRTPTRRAARSRSVRAHSPSVAPVVRTSSTTRTWRPETSGAARKAPRTFARRSDATRSLCGRVARTRASQRGRAGTPSRRATRCASSSA